MTSPGATSRGLAADPVVAPVDERLTVAAGRGDPTALTSFQGFVPEASEEKRSPRGASVFLWVAFLVIAAGLTRSYYVFPAYQSPLWTCLGLSAVAATVAGVRRNRPRKPVAWYLLAAAELTFVAGDTSYNVLTQVMHQDNPFPSVADLFYLLTYVFIAAGDRKSTRLNSSHSS